MAATDHEGPAGVPSVESAPPDPTVPSGDEPLTADLVARPPRLSTRVLVAIVLVLAVVLLASVVVAVVVLHQPHLSPVPVPSTSSIA